MRMTKGFGGPKKMVTKYGTHTVITSARAKSRHRPPPSYIKNYTARILVVLLFVSILFWGLEIMVYDSFW